MASRRRHEAARLFLLSELAPAQTVVVAMRNTGTPYYSPPLEYTSTRYCVIEAHGDEFRMNLHRIGFVSVNDTVGLFEWRLQNAPFGSFRGRIDRVSWAYLK